MSSSMSSSVSESGDREMHQSWDNLDVEEQIRLALHVLQVNRQKLRDELQSSVPHLGSASAQDFYTKVVGLNPDEKEQYARKIALLHQVDKQISHYTSKLENRTTTSSRVQLGSHKSNSLPRRGNAASHHHSDQYYHADHRSIDNLQQHSSEQQRSVPPVGNELNDDNEDVVCAQSWDDVAELSERLRRGSLEKRRPSSTEMPSSSGGESNRFLGPYPETSLESASMISFNSNIEAGGEQTKATEHGGSSHKVEMIHSLISMLGSDPDRHESAKALFALSEKPETAQIMRQSGCLAMLVELLHPRSPSSITEPKDNAQVLPDTVTPNDWETFECAYRAMRNLVAVSQQPREIEILRPLEQIRAVTVHLYYVRAGMQNLVPSLLDTDAIPATNQIVKFSFDEENRFATGQLGGIQAISDLLVAEHHTFIEPPLLKQQAHHPAPQCSTELRKLIGMSLTNLTFGDAQNKAVLCCTPGVLRVVAAKMKDESEEVRQVYANVIRNVAWKADHVSKTQIRKSGAVVALLNAAMESGTTAERTLRGTLSALWNLSSHSSENKEEICRTPGALEFLVSTLVYRGKEGAGSLAVVENGGGILRNISSVVGVREEYRAILRRHGVLKILLQEHLKSSSLTVVINACGTLWNLSARNAEDQALLWSLGAVPMLQRLCDSKHRMISMGSQAALKNLLMARQGRLGPPLKGTTTTTLDVPMTVVAPVDRTMGSGAPSPRSEGAPSSHFSKSTKSAPLPAKESAPFMTETLQKAFNLCRSAQGSSIISAQDSSDSFRSSQAPTSSVPPAGVTLRTGRRNTPAQYIAENYLNEIVDLTGGSKVVVKLAEQPEFKAPSMPPPELPSKSGGNLTKRSGSAGPTELCVSKQEQLKADRAEVARLHQGLKKRQNNQNVSFAGLGLDFGRMPSASFGASSSTTALESPPCDFGDGSSDCGSGPRNFAFPPFKGGGGPGKVDHALPGCLPLFDHEPHARGKQPPVVVPRNNTCNQDDESCRDLVGGVEMPRIFAAETTNDTPSNISKWSSLSSLMRDVVETADVPSSRGSEIGKTEPKHSHENEKGEISENEDEVFENHDSQDFYKNSTAGEDDFHGSDMICHGEEENCDGEPIYENAIFEHHPNSQIPPDEEDMADDPPRIHTTNLERESQEAAAAKNHHRSNPQNSRNLDRRPFAPIGTSVQATPDMCSRRSSLSSLDEIDVKSTVDSIYSQQPTGYCSPSELPESPCRTMPPSPKQRRKFPLAQNHAQGGGGYSSNVQTSSSMEEGIQAVGIEEKNEDFSRNHDNSHKILRPNPKETQQPVFGDRPTPNLPNLRPPMNFWSQIKEPRVPIAVAMPMPISTSSPPNQAHVGDVSHDDSSLLLADVEGTYDLEMGSTPLTSGNCSADLTFTTIESSDLEDHHKSSKPAEKHDISASSSKNMNDTIVMRAPPTSVENTPPESSRAGPKPDLLREFIKSAMPKGKGVPDNSPVSSNPQIVKSPPKKAQNSQDFGGENQDSASSILQDLIRGAMPKGAAKSPAKQIRNDRFWRHHKTTAVKGSNSYQDQLMTASQPETVARLEGENQVLSNNVCDQAIPEATSVPNDLHLSGSKGHSQTSHLANNIEGDSTSRDGILEQSAISFADSTVMGASTTTPTHGMSSRLTSDPSPPPCASRIRTCALESPTLALNEIEPPSELTMSAFMKNSETRETVRDAAALGSPSDGKLLTIERHDTALSGGSLSEDNFSLEDLSPGDFPTVIDILNSTRKDDVVELPLGDISEVLQNDELLIDCDALSLASTSSKTSKNEQKSSEGKPKISKPDENISPKPKTITGKKKSLSPSQKNALNNILSSSPKVAVRPTRTTELRARKVSGTPPTTEQSGRRSAASLGPTSRNASPAGSSARSESGISPKNAAINCRPGSSLSNRSVSSASQQKSSPPSNSKPPTGSAKTQITTPKVAAAPPNNVKPLAKVTGSARVATVGGGTLGKKAGSRENVRPASTERRQHQTPAATSPPPAVPPKPCGSRNARTVVSTNVSPPKSSKVEVPKVVKNQNTHQQQQDSAEKSPPKWDDENPVISSAESNPSTSSRSEVQEVESLSKNEKDAKEPPKTPSRSRRSIGSNVSSKIAVFARSIAGGTNEKKSGTEAQRKQQEKRNGNVSKAKLKEDASQPLEKKDATESKSGSSSSTLERSVAHVRASVKKKLLVTAV